VPDEISCEYDGAIQSEEKFGPTLSQLGLPESPLRGHLTPIYVHRRECGPNLEQDRSSVATKCPRGVDLEGRWQISTGWHAGFHHQHRLLTEEFAVEVTGIISALVIGLIIGVLGRVVAPGKQKIPLWLTLLVGIVAALVGTAIAAALGVAATRGLDWIEMIIQVALAAIGVAIMAGLYHRRRDVA
jgi:uncharacterized membrane protein YeaQ/YmgE (transglycosylase-associated protein family)